MAMQPNQTFEINDPNNPMPRQPAGGAGGKVPPGKGKQSEKAPREPGRSRNATMTTLAAVLLTTAGVYALYQMVKTDVPSPNGELKDVLAYTQTEDFRDLPKQEQEPYRARLADARANPQETEQLDRRDQGQLQRSQREQQMEERVDRYFAAKPEDRTKLLDEMIDEFRTEWEARRAERDQNGGAAQDGQNAAGGDRGPRGEGGRGDGAQANANGDEQTAEQKQRQEEREQRSKERAANARRPNPVRTAQRLELFSALRQRAEERGITMGGPGGGPRGGGGGGR